MTNLKTLATHLGLSQATVSRALNGYSTVNSETKKRVLEAAQSLNYQPNSQARRLATGRAGAFGLVLPAADNLLANPHFVDFLAGITSALAAKDIDVMLTASDDTSTYRRYAQSGKVDGLVISNPKIDDERVKVLTELNFPFVVHGRASERKSHAYYDIDNYQAFKDATDHLLDLGHRRIGLLNGPADATFAKSRLQGYQDALVERGLAVDPSLALHMPMNEEQGYRNTRILCAQAQRPTAILCSSTLMTLGLTRRLREEKLHMGRDISVISHDDGLASLKTENFSVPLTVTYAPIRHAGKAIAEMLVQRAAGASIRALQTTAPVELIVRASTGTAPQ